jgi:hypothetical protein
VRFTTVCRISAFVLLAQSAAGFEMSSPSYRIRGGNLNGGGVTAMVSTAPAPGVGSLGASIGQSEALGFSGSTVTLRTIAPGFWPIVAGGFPHLDADLDVIQAFRDDCPFAYDPAQSDSGGVGTLAPDGIGDACQCGDVDDDGVVDDLDVIAYRDSLADPLGSALSLAGTAKCSVVDHAAACEILDVAITRRALYPLDPAIEQVCSAATPAP